jgi:hypothetical protein
MGKNNSNGNGEAPPHKHNYVDKSDKGSKDPKTGLTPVYSWKECACGDTTGNSVHYE